MAKAFCPGCRQSVDMDPHVEVGEWVSCPRCEADLEVISRNPLVLDWADEGLENEGIVWTNLAGNKWSKWGKEPKRKSFARVFRDDDELD